MKIVKKIIKSSDESKMYMFLILGIILTMAYIVRLGVVNRKNQMAEYWSMLVDNNFRTVHLEDGTKIEYLEYLDDMKVSFEFIK